jgi:hypothetical protein
MEMIAELANSLANVAWPALVGYVVLSNRKVVSQLLETAVARVSRGDEIKVGLITIGQSVGLLKVPPQAGLLTDDHVALVHRSWRVPHRDSEFGRPMHQIHVILFGTPEALQRVDHVLYHLTDAYPDPVRRGGALASNFELKELANGYSLIRAEVHVRGQSEPVRLSRLIDLTDQSSPLRGSYQNMSS